MWNISRLQYLLYLQTASLCYKCGSEKTGKCAMNTERNVCNEPPCCSPCRPSSPWPTPTRTSWWWRGWRRCWWETSLVGRTLTSRIPTPARFGCSDSLTDWLTPQSLQCPNSWLRPHFLPEMLENPPAKSNEWRSWPSGFPVRLYLHLSKSEPVSSLRDGSLFFFLFHNPLQRVPRLPRWQTSMWPMFK